MRMNNVYPKIEEVLKTAGRALAPHEFESVIIQNKVDINRPGNGREYIGCSESALGRRLRELRQMGRVTSKRREGTSYVEYALVVKAPAVAPQPEFAGQHSGGL